MCIYDCSILNIHLVCVDLVMEDGTAGVQRVESRCNRISVHDESVDKADDDKARLRAAQSDLTPQSPCGNLARIATSPIDRDNVKIRVNLISKMSCATCESRALPQRPVGSSSVQPASKTRHFRGGFQ